MTPQITVLQYFLLGSLPHLVSGAPKLWLCLWTGPDLSCVGGPQFTLGVFIPCPEAVLTSCAPAQ